jgi:hypothetical protein
MNKIFIFFITAGLVMAAVGCKKASAPPPANYDQNPTSYELVSIITTSGSLVSGFSFTYDTTNLLSSYRQFAYSTSPTYVIPGDSLPYTCSFVRNNGVVTEKNCVWASTGNVTTTTYQYNSDGQNISTKSFVQVPNYTSDTLVTLYTYDSRGNLTTVRYQGEDADTYIVTYDPENNISAVTEPQYGEAVFGPYDDKINYMRAINGLLPTERLNLVAPCLPSYCPNNPTKAAYSYTVSPLATMSYQYNETGLPVSIAYGQNSPTTILTYRKYK